MCRTEKENITNKIRILMLFLVMISAAVLFSGCSETESANVEETSQSELSEVENRTIEITDSYSYTLPDSFMETEENADESKNNYRSFVSDDGLYEIRSFSENDEEFVFPDDAEAISDDPEAETGYGGLYDTAIAKITDTVKAENGECRNRILFVWPDGAYTMCYLEVTSSDGKPDDLADELRDSICNCDCDADYECGTYGPDGYYQPSEEEIDQAMLYEAQDAYEDYINGQINDYTFSYPY